MTVLGFGTSALSSEKDKQTSGGGISLTENFHNRFFWSFFPHAGDRSTARTGTHRTVLFPPRLQRAWLAWRSAAIRICLWSNRSLHPRRSLQSCPCSRNPEGKVSRVSLYTSHKDKRHLCNFFHTFPPCLFRL